MKNLLLLILINTSITFAQKDLYLLIGQSNMAGRAPIEVIDQQTFPNVYLFNSTNTWEIASNPLNKYSTVRKDISLQHLGPGYTFSKKLTETYPNTKIGLVVNAKGGTFISEWQKGQLLYNEALKRIQAALAENPGNTLKAIIWHQGESDSTISDQYTAKFKQMITDFRNDLNLPNLPIIAGQIGEFIVGQEAINQVISELPNNVEDTYYVSSQGLLNFDAFHFNSASQRILGERYADKMIEIINNQTLEINSPIIEKIKVPQNPVKDNLYIGTNKIDYIVLFDSNGKMIKDIKIKDGNIDVSNLATGVYHLQVISNNKPLQLKFIKN